MSLVSVDFPQALMGAVPQKSPLCSGVLVEQMCVLCMTLLFKNFNLHHLQKEEHIHGWFCGLSEIMPFEYLLILLSNREDLQACTGQLFYRAYLMKSTFVPILLQELHLSFGFFISRLLCCFPILLQSLLFWQSSLSLYFLTLLLPAYLFHFLLPNPAQFLQPPSFKLGSCIKAVCIIHIQNNVIFLFCRTKLNE